MRPPVGNIALYNEKFATLVARYRGAGWILDDWAHTTGAKAGTVAEIGGLYPGAISGTTYYNQVVVTGTLNPDATGTYTAAGMYANRPYYKRGADNWYIYSIVGNAAWVISKQVPYSSGEDWFLISQSLAGVYTAEHGATGNPTVANVTASGIYLFVPSGVTLQSAGPTLAGTACKAAAFDGAAGYVSLATKPTLSTAFTAAAWVYIANWTAAKYPITQRAAANTGQFSLSIDATTGYLSSAIPTGAAIGAISSALAVPTGAWAHIALTYDGTNRYHYVNGVASAADTSRSGALNGTASTLYLSRYLTTYSPMSQCYAAVLPEALSAAEIYALYKAQP